MSWVGWVLMVLAVFMATADDRTAAAVYFCAAILLEEAPGRIAKEIRKLYKGGGE